MGPPWHKQSFLVLNLFQAVQAQQACTVSDFTQVRQTHHPFEFWGWVEGNLPPRHCHFLERGFVCIKEEEGLALGWRQSFLPVATHEHHVVGGFQASLPNDNSDDSVLGESSDFGRGMNAFLPNDKAWMQGGIPSAFLSVRAQSSMIIKTTWVDQTHMIMPWQGFLPLYLWDHWTPFAEALAAVATRPGW